ncbi:Glycerophosphoryl diester phosphodiesterase [Candidatus Nitrospira inopinata]|uniref:glycerophosphodiester phosphodiesterase n=2 Tax=Candidatus Nitrospira inopinata TaxID=1715989 RepID=A0A0S4KSA7_9BACT|nr:glycerophosphodiester phosphodiesterase [Candidatus Nitrospira inopinata]CUQ67331.1 Glycerophosphoryl diester phosphodiesterase [Candidatus Nitrospira inopinata]
MHRVLSTMAFSIMAVVGLTMIDGGNVGAQRGERWGTDRQQTPIVIAHRGASGYVPEHTLAAYAISILQGADFVEPDLVMTKDGHLIARHDNVLDLTTDVSRRPEFAGRKATKTVDGARVTGWFSEDFTLGEIKTLRAIERIPGTRPANTRFDGQFEIPTLQEIIDLVQAYEKLLNRRIGIYIETKHPTYFERLGLPFEEPLVKILRKNGYEGRNQRVFIQSFEINNLRKLSRMTRIPLVQLLWIEGKPYDVEAGGGTLTYEQMATPAGLAQIAAYAQGVGPEKRFIIPLDSSGNLDPSRVTRFVQDAHAVGLVVHPYTFRSENAFLPMNLRSSGDPTALGDGAGEMLLFLRTGIDGLFTDHTDQGVAARDAYVRTR